MCCSILARRSVALAAASVICCSHAGHSSPLPLAPDHAFAPPGGGASCPNPSHDCSTPGGPGCADAECCSIVCVTDPACCSSSWDALCVAKAQATCGTSPCGDCCPGDLDASETVNAADLGILLAQWGESDSCAELTGDGVVDGADVGALLAAWNSPCPTEVECHCGSAEHDCCEPGGPGCAQSQCCTFVCGGDPSCCETAWDAGCVDAAQAMCGHACVSCTASDHDCCTVGAPGCSSQECCEAVCVLDGYCCVVAWDRFCTGAADLACDDSGCGGG